MDRPRLLILTAITLILGVSVYSIWSNWGLITVHADGQPISEVIRSINKQAGIQLRTNIEGTQPVTMHVDKVPLTEALETLAAVTDAQWRLTYFYAADRATIDAALAELSTSGRRPEGWKNFELPGFGSNTDALPAADPRRIEWEVKAPEEKNLQGWLRAAAIGVSAGFTCPESFNPTVSSGPSSGPIHKKATALADLAGAKVEEAFLLIAGRRGGETADAGDEENPERARRREGMGAMMRERRIAEIAKLPPGQRESAQKEFDEISSLMESARNLPPEERRAKMEEFFQNSDRAQRMEDRRMQHEERQTPEQRHKRYQKYVDRKRSSQSANSK